jgi:DNA polymerase III sliding clamp (beta) subunit (PCNA family)
MTTETKEKYMQEFLIKVGDLNNAIKSLQPFISKEETRYYLKGIFIESIKGAEYANFVATDGHKLCVMKLDVHPLKDNNENISTIVPTSAIKVILQMLKGEKSDVFVVLRFDGARKVIVDLLNKKAEFRCIDGNFPDYRKVIPDGDAKFTIGLQKEQAKEAAKAVTMNKGKEAMVWHLVDENSPIKMVGENKIVVVMPTRQSFEEIDLGVAA